MVHYKLTYFNGRGLAETARQIFAYAGVEFEDVRFPHDEERAAFKAFKPKAPFGQVPVLEVDGKMLSQSNAINRFLGRQFGLAGANDFEAAQIDALADGLQDMRQKLYPWHMEKDPAKKKELFEKLVEETLKPGLQRFEKFLTDNGHGHFVGSKMSWFDIQFAETLSNYEEFLHDVLKEFPKLHEFTQKIRSHPNLKKWIDNRPKGEF